MKQKNFEQAGVAALRARRAENMEQIAAAGRKRDAEKRKDIERRRAHRRKLKPLKPGFNVDGTPYVAPKKKAKKKTAKKK